MSRVRIGQKYMNISHPDGFNGGPSKMKRIHSEKEDFHNVSCLSHWLFVKYNMSYKAFRNKSRKRRDELRDEYVRDTGNPYPSGKGPERELDI